MALSDSYSPSHMCLPIFPRDTTFFISVLVLQTFLGKEPDLEEVVVSLSCRKLDNNLGRLTPERFTVVVGINHLGLRNRECWFMVILELETAYVENTCYDPLVHFVGSTGLRREERIGWRLF